MITMTSKTYAILCFACLLVMVHCQSNFDRIIKKGDELAEELGKLEMRASTLLNAAYEKLIKAFAQSLKDEAVKSGDEAGAFLKASPSLDEDFKQRRTRYDQVITQYAQYENKQLIF